MSGKAKLIIAAVVLIALVWIGDDPVKAGGEAKGAIDSLGDAGESFVIFIRSLFPGGAG